MEKPQKCRRAAAFRVCLLLVSHNLPMLKHFHSVSLKVFFIQGRSHASLHLSAIRYGELQAAQLCAKQNFFRSNNLTIFLPSHIVC